MEEVSMNSCSGLQAVPSDTGINHKMLSKRIESQPTGKKEDGDWMNGYSENWRMFDLES
jgi:hypothetical protein